MMKRRLKDNAGIALILVISVLAVMVSLVAAFLVAARLESLKSINFKESMKASSIADAGVEHAKSLLRQDKQSNGFDHYNEIWRKAFEGGDVDNDGNGTAEAKWIDLVDGSGTTYGRYAVTVVDEAGKVNINSAGYYNEDPLKIVEGWSPFEVSLNKLFQELGAGKPIEMRDELIKFRYGGNVPGDNSDDNGNNVFLSNDGSDNDADGEVDEISEGTNEPMEFHPAYPYGDDEPFLTIHHIKKIPALQAEFNSVERYLSAYSKDKNITSHGAIRLDINHSSPMDFINVFDQYVTVSGAEQYAANIVDFRDKNNKQTVVVTGKGTFYGAEAVRINELMIKPLYSINAEDHTNLAGPGGNWVKNGSYYSNSAPEVAGLGGIWWFENLRPGKYYLRLFGTGSNQTIGDVKVGIKTHVSMKHGDTFVDAVEVGSDGRLKITISNAEVQAPGFTTYFNRFELSEQPDSEYIELINVSDKAVDLSNWKVEGLRQNDLIGIIPAGATIDPFDYLVLAVDRNDSSTGVPAGLSSNEIAFSKTWTDPNVDLNKVVQLEFTDTVSRTDDVINNNPGTYNIIIYLKDADDNVVDRVKYSSSDALFYRSSERDDPVSSASSDNSHIFDKWNASDGFDLFLPQGTPTAENNNLNVAGHTFGGLNTEVVVKNNPLSNVGELLHVAGSSSWSRIGLGTLYYTADHFASQSIHLEAEGNVDSAGGWQEVFRPAPLTNWFVSTSAGSEGTWKFDKEDRLINGMYRLNIYGNANEALSISIRRADGSWTDYTPPLTPDSQGVIYYGVIDIGGDSDDATPDREFEIKIKNDSESGNASFDFLALSPAQEVFGRININTAPVPVLKALPGVTDEVASRIYNSPKKPFGDDYGLGDILYSGNVVKGEAPVLADDPVERRKIFRKIANLITVQSDVFEIFVTAETFRNNRRSATEKIRTIVER